MSAHILLNIIFILRSIRDIILGSNCIYKIHIVEDGCPATFSARIQPLPDTADSEEDLYQDSSHITEGGR